MSEFRYRPEDYRKLPKKNLDRMISNNPYINRIYEYGEQLLPHPDLDSFNSHWQSKVNHSSKVHAEIGCGSGKYIIQLAKEYPNDAFFGMELRFKRLVLAARKIKREKIRNILLIRDRGEYLDDYFSSDSIDALHLNFPDPWSKNARRKHRIINKKFISMMHQLLRLKGKIYFKTDHLEYFKFTYDLLLQSGLFKITDHTFDLHQSKYSLNNILTEFEILFASKDNRPIGYLNAQRINTYVELL